MINLELFFSNFGTNPNLCREAHATFSQNGEDIVVDLLLSREAERGIFVDIGAYHPFRFSNTFNLYLQGWRGVNVDANAAAIEMFKAVRPDDINIHALVSDRVEPVQYFKFSEGAWNTTNAAAAEELRLRNRPECTPVGVETLHTRPVNDILSEHVGGKKFDFLNLDVEGLDERILFSLDFERFRPKVMAVELGIDLVTSEPLRSFFSARNYKLHSHCFHTAIFLRQ